MAAFPDVCEEEDGKDCSLAGSLAAAEAVVDEATLSEMLRADRFDGGNWVKALEDALAGFNKEDGRFP